MRASTTLLLLGLAACAEAPRPAGADAAPASHAVADDVAYQVSPWSLPASGSAAQPDLVADARGRLLLSWISVEPDGHALRLAIFDGGRWSAPREIARGDDWFVNWADTPHVVATGDGAQWAHWLRRSADAPYAYDVVLSRSGDDGATWSEPVLINDDGTPTEHGFVSMWPHSREAVGIAWLDGRNTSPQAHAGHEGHGGGGAMSLRTALVDTRLQRSAERELDARTCDCCQTSAAVTARGALLVYRDRDAHEVRDIAAVRYGDGAWTPARMVHADRWTMPACPVNGPSAAAYGQNAWVGWYTAAGGTPTLRLAHSRDAGKVFGAPADVDRGEAVQGRVVVAADAQGAWVAWLREDTGGQSLWLARYAGNAAHEVQRMRVAVLQGRGRATGFPKLAVHDGAAHLAWTDVVDGRPVLRGARAIGQAGSMAMQRVGVAQRSP
jgi:hypothetical protein